MLITERGGAVLATEGTVVYAPFTNRTQVGRTGRGDTTISAYLSRRLTHSPAERAALRRCPNFAENGNPRPVHRQYCGGGAADERGASDWF